jgi:hypothetical protein
MSSTSSVPRTIVRRLSLVIALGALAAATGCASVPSRVWYNGQAMTQSWQYRDVLAGNGNPAKLRAIYYGSDARRINQRSVQFPAFGKWY